MDKFHYVLLIVALVAFALVVAGYVLKETKDNVNIETRKIRFAAVTFSGIMVLIVCGLIAVMADSSNEELGFQIFEKLLTALSPIAGGIIGYLFSARDTKDGEKRAKQ